MTEITDAMVERLVAFLQSEWGGPYMANVRHYVPADVAAGPDRERALAELHAADRAADAEARRVAHRALEVALGIHS